MNYTPLNHTPLPRYTPLNLNEEPTSRRTLKRTVVFAFIAILAMGSFLATNTILKSKTTKANPPAQTGEKVLGQQEAREGLGALLDEPLTNAGSGFAVAVKNLTTGEEYYYQEGRKFMSASLYKLWIMNMVYDRIEAGSLSADDVLKEDVVELNKAFDIATDEAELAEGTITLSVQAALEQMITVSDNYATYLLADHIGLRTAPEYLKRHGFDASSMTNPPMTTARDILNFFALLRDGKLGSEDSTEAMLELLGAQQLNDILPKYLPEEVTIAHKTAQLERVVHDAGIVTTDTDEYIIVLLSDTAAPLAAREFMSEISEAVYSYFADK